MGREYIGAIDAAIGAYEEGDEAAARVIEENVRAERAQYRHKGSARRWRWQALRGEGASGVPTR